MKRLLTLFIVAAFLRPLAADCTTQYKSTGYASKGLSLTLNDPIGSVYQPGEEVGFSIRTDSPAYVVVFDVDTEGFVHLLYPADGKTLQKFSPDQTYPLPANPDQALVVGGSTGIEFVFALAVDDRDYINEEEVRFLADDEAIPEERQFRITGDPMLGANRVASQIVRGISHRPGVTLSFTYFYIGKAVDFPRYLCEDCYKNGKDPYGPGMQTYVANADFQVTERLTYPLQEGFVPEIAEAAQPLDGGDGTNVTNVYVSNYPHWDDGFYATSWWYLDPWYWGGCYYPYPGSFYASFGWNWGWWGWGAYHYNYFPYYYCGPYYAYYPYGGYYDCYPDHVYPYDSGDWRSFRPVSKKGDSGQLHTAMNHTASRDLRSGQPVLKSSERADQLRYTSTGAMSNIGRDARSIVSRSKSAGEPRVIRDRPTRSYKNDSQGLTRQTRQVQPKRSVDREQRVITRSSKSTRSYIGNDSRTRAVKGQERLSREVNRKFTEPRRSEGSVAPRTSRPRTETRGTYVPNSRQQSSGSGRSYSSPPPRSTGGGKSSARTPASSPSHSSSSRAKH